ncbi:hypothetical protein F53441_14057 [Fusarium austroafricanum]|uniref:Xylanolytic transcriptional activator regulatory domain-containing protein n=1 Tax=Fusarium austroafricanum TaxID=2364996 RepID=A0A8H4JI17_9HYPO|nr:hypothetical protein F53441_14057 [Fusarium austroafricanum]
MVSNRAVVAKVMTPLTFNDSTNEISIAEYDQTCHYARSIARRGRKPNSRKQAQQAQHDSQGESSEADCELEQSTPRPNPDRSMDYDATDTTLLPADNQDSVSSHHDATPIDIQINSTTTAFHHSHHGLDDHSSYSLPDFGLAVRNIIDPASVLSAQNEAPSTTAASQPQHCRYKCLEPIIPMLEGIIDAGLVCELLELYFVEPGGSLFRCSSPYVLAHVLRKETLLRSNNPRTCTPALLVTMLWGRDRDVWNRTTGGPLVREFEYPAPAGGLQEPNHTPQPPLTESPPVPLVDDVLMFVLVTIVVSGGDFKTDCLRWWNKVLRLSTNMGLNREDAPEDDPSPTEANVCTGRTNLPCGCRPCEASRTGLSITEIREERRRVFWLIFCLDRHLALSFNAPLRILDDECQLYAPLPDQVWEALSEASADSLQQRSFGAPTRIVGTGYFEYFLPLMTILGDVVQLHRQKCHPRFGNMRRSRNNGHDDEDDPATAMIEQIMAECAQSIADLASAYQVDALDGSVIPASQVRTPNSAISSQHIHEASGSPANHTRRSPSHRQYAQAQLVTAYSTFILHVLHVLLHGKWDAVSMLDNKDGWIPSVGFMKCASHAIAASDAMSRILACDPELSFMPYLFGIYLLHGSFILLLFADRMPQLGLNESVEKACEIIIRAHEVCVVTLSTEFQRKESWDI